MLSKVIAIAQQKGGTGKTTLAVHLALAFIKYHNLKVAIIDTDPQGSLGKWFMIRTEKKISNDNLTFKTASLWGAQYESKTLKNDNDIVIIDTPPKIESDARPSIEAADLVLIPMAASHVDFWATGAIVEIAKKANKKILIQINRSNQRSKLITKTNDFIKSLNFKTASLWGAQYESKILKKDHDVIIIDTPPKIESDARPSIEAADLVLIPVTPSHVDFWATEAIVEIAKKANKKILIQINRANQRSKLISKTNEYIKSINVSSTNTIIGNRQIYASSMGEGKTAVEKQKKSNAVEEMKKLSDQILEELK